MVAMAERVLAALVAIAAARGNVVAAVVVPAVGRAQMALLLVPQRCRTLNSFQIVR
jgi:hypothetical protein